MITIIVLYYHKVKISLEDEMSDLIEHFGGYEKCKEIVNQPLVDFAMTAQALREAMLEYRREHGIFEVGDAVTSKGYEGNIHYVKEVVSEDSMIIFSNFMACPQCVFKDSFRHATPEEIAAGHRL